MRSICKFERALTVLRLVHRLVGFAVSLWLLLLGATGALLAFKDDWLRLTQPGIAGPPPIGPVTTPSGLARRVSAAEAAFGVDRVWAMVLAGPSVALDQVYLRDHSGGGYLDPETGAVIARWTGAERFVDVLFDLHHTLLLGGTGKKAVGIVGLVGAALALSGLALAWPSLRRLRGTVWPRTMARSGFVAAHRELGLIAALPLLVVMLTGAAVIFPATAKRLLGGTPPLSAPTATPGNTFTPSDVAWEAVFSTALARFPNASLRVVVWPETRDTSLTVWLRQPTEWHPNGRTTVQTTAAGDLIDARDAVAAPLPDRLVNAAYPIHAAKLGGPLYKSLIALAGLALTLLSSYGAIAYARHLLGRTWRNSDSKASNGADSIRH